MSEVSTIAAEPRDRAGKGAARAVRRSGQIPGVIYGAKQPAVLISLDPRALLAEMRKPGFTARIFEIKVNGETHRTLARDVQFHLVTDKPIHVDFMRFSADSELEVMVPVHFRNEMASPGLKRGGVLNIVRHEVGLICSPDNIPSGIDIDLTGLDIGASVHISHVALPAGTRPAIADRDFTIATIAAPTVVRAEATETAAEETAEE